MYKTKINICPNSAPTLSIKPLNSYDECDGQTIAMIFCPLIKLLPLARYYLTHILMESTHGQNRAQGSRQSQYMV